MLCAPPWGAGAWGTERAQGADSLFADRELPARHWVVLPQAASCLLTPWERLLFVRGNGGRQRVPQLGSSPAGMKTRGISSGVQLHIPHP